MARPKVLVQFDQTISLYAIAGATGGGAAVVDGYGYETNLSDTSDGVRTLVTAEVPANIKEKMRRDLTVAGKPEQVTEYDVTIRYPHDEINVNHALQVDWLEEDRTLYAQNVLGNQREGLTIINCARRER